MGLDVEKLEVGDRVVVIRGFKQSSIDFEVGETGTFMGLSAWSCDLCIEWDKTKGREVELHTCDGLVPTGYGYNISTRFSKDLQVTTKTEKEYLEKALLELEVKTKEISDRLSKVIKEEEEELKKEKERLNKNTFFTPEFNGEFYYIDMEGDVAYDTNGDFGVDRAKFELGNCFPTEEDAEFAVEVIKLDRELRHFAFVNNETPIDWTDASCNRYSLAISYHEEEPKLYVEPSCLIRRSKTIYFSSREIAEKAVEFFGEEKLLKYL
jgi:hypothetical protein